jgi:hypothetical protein
MEADEGSNDEQHDDVVKVCNDNESEDEGGDLKGFVVNEAVSDDDNADKFREDLLRDGDLETKKVYQSIILG